MVDSQEDSFAFNPYVAPEMLERVLVDRSLPSVSGQQKADLLLSSGFRFRVVSSRCFCIAGFDNNAFNGERSGSCTASLSTVSRWGSGST